MSRVWNCGVEMNTLTAALGDFNEAVIGTGCSIESTIVRSGSRSIKVDLVSGARSGVVHDIGAANTDSFSRVYIRPATLPSVESTIIVFSSGSGGTAARGVYITLDSGGLLRLYDEDGAIGSASSALTNDSWSNRIEIEINLSGVTPSGMICRK